MYLKYFTTLMNRQACSLLAITLVAAQRRPQPRPPGRRRGPRVAYCHPVRTGLRCQGRGDGKRCWADEACRAWRGNNSSQKSRDDCDARDGNDIRELWTHLDNGMYSYRLYGATNKMPPCSQLRLIWLPLVDDATLETIFLCFLGGVPQPTPRNLLTLPPMYVYRDTAMVPAVRNGEAKVRQQPLSPRCIASHTWVEVSHCPVGGEKEYAWFFRLPGSGLSIYTGRVHCPDHAEEIRARAKGHRVAFEEFKAQGVETLHFPETKDLSEEIILLRDVAKEAETRLPHNAVSMTALVRAGIVKCGQPPNVRNCSSDEPAVRLTRVDCPSRPRPGSTPEYLYFTPFAANRFSDVHRERLLGRTGGVHLCKAGDAQVVDPARSIGNYRLKGELPSE